MTDQQSKQAIMAASDEPKSGQPKHHKDKDHGERRSLHWRETMMTQPSSLGSFTRQYDYDDDDDDQPFGKNHDIPPKPSSNYNLFERASARMARYPKTHFWVSLVVTVVLGGLGFLLGNFSTDPNNSGFQARGTLIANRQTQLQLVQMNIPKLLMTMVPGYDGDNVWEDLITNVQPGWEGRDSDEEEDEDAENGENATDTENDTRRRLKTVSSRRKSSSSSSSWNSFWNQNDLERFGYHEMAKAAHPSVLSDIFHHRRRHLQESSTNDTIEYGGILEGCDASWYTDGRMTNETRLWPIWKVPANQEADSILDPAILLEICRAEETTQGVLEEAGLCEPLCGETTHKCLPPFSIVLLARMTIVPQGLELPCEDLAHEWELVQSQATNVWSKCSRARAQPGAEPDELIEAGLCPPMFHPALVDAGFLNDGNRVEYTSSIFATNSSTREAEEELYALEQEFGRGSDRVVATYDTQNRAFARLLSRGAIDRDMLLAMGSAVITTLAMLVHTKSPFLTLVGLVQIILSFPLAFFVYSVVAGLAFFPFLNFIGVFVVFALGADHIFVAVDKWKNARIDHPSWTTEQIAALALPDAATATGLTTITTAVAFFGSTICPVAPVKLFAAFCGLLVMLDYLLDVLLVFPCLCLYDGYLIGEKKINGCIDLASCCCCRKSRRDARGDNDDNQDADKDKPMSLIHRILTAYYNGLHAIRWPLLVACLGALAVCLYFATKLGLPVNNDVELLKDTVEYVQNSVWRNELLSTEIARQGGGSATIMWGTQEGDTGDHNNPESFTQLLLDSEFDPSTPQAQTWLMEFCPWLMEQDFASGIEVDYVCPFTRFDEWLQNQTSILETKAALFDEWLKSNQTITMDYNETADMSYILRCNRATGMPMDPAFFHGCVSAWALQSMEISILSRDNLVTIIMQPFTTRVRWDSPNSEIEAEWKLIQEWMDSAQETAPKEVSQAFFSSVSFWWYDTNIQMFQSAYGSAAIAMAASALVILLSSRSFAMTLFSVVSVGYVLASVTAMMAGVGWTLGFLESICFSILIGVSVDFVIHFSHAYTTPSGKMTRSARTKHALIHMGPSILAAAFTTLAGAAIMLFCVITFFTKFATVLFFAIAQASVGSFIFFLTLTDTIGPEQPTFLADKMAARCCGGADPDDAAVSEPKPVSLSANKKDVVVDEIAAIDESVNKDAPINEEARG